MAILQVKNPRFRDRKHTNRERENSPLSSPAVKALRGLDRAVRHGDILLFIEDMVTKLLLQYHIITSLPLWF